MTLAMGAMALGVYASSLRGMSPVHPRYSFPWWVLAALFFLAEMAVVHLPLGRQTLTFTLTEIPLTLGLFLTTPADLLLAQLIGAGVALAVHRRLGPAKLAFNLSHYMLGSTVAISVFRVLVAPGAVGEMTWLAAYLATGAMTVVSAIAISAGMSIVEGRPQGEVLTKGIAFGLVSALLNTSAGLIGVLLLEVAPHALLLMTVPSAILFAAYRSLAAHRRGERRTRILNVCMSAIHRDADADSVIRSLVSSLRENFGAELAEIVLFSERRRWGIRSILRPDGDRPVLERTEPTPSEGALRDLAEPVMLVAERPLDEPLRSWMTERALREALATPVLGRDGRSLGCIVVADRLSDREGFAAGDLEVVQVLAGQVGLVIERAGLVARLRRSLIEVDRFASIVRSSRDAIIGLTPEGAIATWNPGAEHLMRLAEREAIGRQPDIFLPPDERAAFRTQLAKVLDGVELEEEAGHVLSGGEPVPVSLLMSPITDTRGRAIGASVIIRDERDRRRREQTLRRSEERFRKVFEEGSVGMVLTDPDLRIIRANEAFGRMVGHAPERLRDLPFDTIVHPPDTGGSGGWAQRADGAPGGFEARVITASGQTLLARTTSWPIPEGDGEGWSRLTMVEDVTERTLGERRLREMESRFRQVVLAMTGLRDRQLVLQAVADAARVLSNADYALLGVIGSSGDTMEAFVLSGADSAAAEWLSHTGSPGVRGFETWIMDTIRRGRTMHARELGDSLREAGVPVASDGMSLLGIPVAHGDQALGYLMLASRGGTKFDERTEEVATALASQAVVAIENARVHARNEELVTRLRNSGARLRRANAVKSGFLATLSHELRTPMATILLASDLMRDPSHQLPSTRAQELGDKIHSNATHLVNLIDELVDLSKIEAGRLDVSVHPVPVAPLVADSLAAVGPIADERGVVLELATLTDAWIYADALRARQVLLNLLSNAIKFTPRGGRVDVEVTRSGEETTIAVHDQGIGIRRRDLRRIFEPFERMDPDAGPGVGLGLTIASHLMSLHDGRLDASSVRGKGSTFTAVFRTSPKVSAAARGQDDPKVASNGHGGTSVPDHVEPENEGMVLRQHS